MNTEALIDTREPPALDLTGVHVLIVEDDEDSRELMTTVLEDCNATVAIAGSGEEALLRVGEHTFDVIVSDLGLPDFDGCALIKQIRALPRGREVPAIALTGRAGLEEARRALMAGFQVHLAKPTDAWLLANAIANVVGMPILDASLDASRDPGPSLD